MNGSLPESATREVNEAPLQAYAYAKQVFAAERNIRRRTSRRTCWNNWPGFLSKTGQQGCLPQMTRMTRTACHKTKPFAELASFAAFHDPGPGLMRNAD
jgi:hypothetical protein